MQNRWSDAARAAALLVRRNKRRAVNQAPGKPPRRKQPGPDIHVPPPNDFVGAMPTPSSLPASKDPNRDDYRPWVPPPGHPLWNDPKFVASFYAKHPKATRPKTPSVSTTPKPSDNGARVTIAGQMYIKSGNTLIPYRSTPGQPYKTFYEKG